MDKDKYIHEMRDVLMRAEVVLREVISANSIEDVAREISIVAEMERLLQEKP